MPYFGKRKIAEIEAKDVIAWQNQLLAYKDKNGKSEIEEYIRILQEKGISSKDSRIKVNKIISYINQLSIKGLELGEPYLKHLEDEIWELRPLRDRILFTYYDNNNFILLHSFMKRTQKTPRREIKRALINLEDYKRRSDKND